MDAYHSAYSPKRPAISDFFNDCFLYIELQRFSKFGEDKEWHQEHDHRIPHSGVWRQLGGGRIDVYDREDSHSIDSMLSKWSAP